MYMSENGYRLGGEQSGHIIFSKYAATGDGLITAIKMMEVMVLGKQTLSQLRRGFVSYPQKLTNVRVMDKAAAREDADVQVLYNALLAELLENGFLSKLLKADQKEAEKKTPRKK